MNARVPFLCDRGCHEEVPTISSTFVLVALWHFLLEEMYCMVARILEVSPSARLA
jgi:hypothetical protein